MNTISMGSDENISLIISECMFSYGENCQYDCNIQCINQTCDRITGSCLYGCQEGEQCDRGMFLRFRCILEKKFFINNVQSCMKSKVVIIYLTIKMI